MAFEFNNPLLYELREGSALDPYASKVDSSVITNNKIILSELPDQFSGITIPNYSESKSPSDLISTSFYCNYLNGTLSFSSTENGKTVTATYLGRGIIAIPAERIYTKSVDGSSTETFQQVADSVGNASTVLSNLSSSILTGNTTNSNLISSISTANSTKTDLNDMNIIAIAIEESLSSANVVASEATRVQNESQRLLNEGIRVNSEVTRVSAENIRKSAEEIRIPAEVNRNNAESARLIAENLRIAQNNNSISAENIRIASENERINEEVVRQDNENTRLSQESSRVIAESSRVGVENTRVSQELSRVEVENTRVTSENIRLASEISRVGVESTRVSSENIRESNEETRLSQESTREINEDSRISDESNREINELTRISQEDIRESQEENRQNTYSSGHINFKGVITGIASLPSSNNILGDTYQVIDDAITANNAMWRYSGTVFEKSYVLDLAFAGGYGANDSQVFTSTEGQTVFTLTEFPYLIGVNQLMVYVTGIKQIIGVNYNETSTNSFTLTSSVVAGTKVEAFRSVPGGAGSLTTQEVESARVSSLGVGYANLKARLDDHDSNKVGDLANLPTVAKSDIVSSITEVSNEIAVLNGVGEIVEKANISEIGDKTLLPAWLQESLRDVTRMHDDYLRQFAINIRQPPYNAKGDGTNEAAIIKLAVSTGKNIFLPGPDSKYGMDEELLLITPNQIIFGSGMGNNIEEGVLGYVNNSTLLFLTPTVNQRSVRTRVKYRETALDSEDDPISTAVNIQAENVTLKDLCVRLNFSGSETDKNNLGDDWDVGIFVGCRTHISMSDLAVVGYWRKASILVDVTSANNLPRYNNYPNSPFVNNGCDGLQMVNVQTYGGLWGLRIKGIDLKPGETTQTDFYYYDSVSDSAVLDYRGSAGCSDFLAIGCAFYGRDHHTHYRTVDYTGVLADDLLGGGCYFIDGYTLNENSALQGHRFIGCRFATWEPVICYLNRTARDNFISCHFESHDYCIESDETVVGSVGNPWDTTNRYGPIAEGIHRTRTKLIFCNWDPFDAWFSYGPYDATILSDANNKMRTGADSTVYGNTLLKCNVQARCSPTLGWYFNVTDDGVNPKFSVQYTPSEQTLYVRMDARDTSGVTEVLKLRQTASGTFIIFNKGLTLNANSYSFADVSGVLLFQILSSGNASLPVQGTGLILKSPDGLVTKKLTIDNSGSLVLL